MRYCLISKEMSSLYFGLAVFCLFEARVPEFDKQPFLPATVEVYTAQFWDSSFELAEYIMSKIQGRHLLADVAISHLCGNYLRKCVVQKSFDTLPLAK